MALVWPFTLLNDTEAPIDPAVFDPAPAPVLNAAAIATPAVIAWTSPSRLAVTVAVAASTTVAPVMNASVVMSSLLLLNEPAMATELAAVLTKLAAPLNEKMLV